MPELGNARFDVDQRLQCVGNASPAELAFSSAPAPPQLQCRHLRAALGDQAVDVEPAAALTAGAGHLKHRVCFGFQF